MRGLRQQLAIIEVNQELLSITLLHMWEGMTSLSARHIHSYAAGLFDSNCHIFDGPARL